jgi:hypothetical protein
MAVIGDILFMRVDHAAVSDVIRHVEGQLAAQVNEYDQRRFDTEADEQVVENLARNLRVEPLHVDFEQGEKKVEEVQVTIRDHFSGQAQVPGYRVTKTFAFTGDDDLWTIGTGQWSSMMPYGEVHRGSITIGMEVRTNDTDTAVKHITSTIEDIKGYLERQRGQLETFNSSLPDKLLPLVQARRSRRGQAQSLLDRF